MSSKSFDSELGLDSVGIGGGGLEELMLAGMRGGDGFRV
jgi:hypothetical protein